MISGSVKDLFIHYASHEIVTGGQFRGITKMILHPKLKQDQDESYFDIALLEVDHDFDFKIAKPLALPEPGEIVGSHYNCFVAGYGFTLQPNNRQKGFMSSTILLGTYVPTWPFKACKKTLSNYVVTKEHLCAGYWQGGKGVCNGDSGGGFQCNDTLFGILSWDIGCTMSDHPGIYTRVSAFRDWIKDNSGV